MPRWLIAFFPHVGSSSGLHHDYHDNLYCLLRGRKRFRIFPPAMTQQLYTHGSIHTIHPNGRIVYEGQVGIQAFASLSAVPRCSVRFHAG